MTSVETECLSAAANRAAFLLTNEYDFEVIFTLTFGASASPQRTDARQIASEGLSIARALRDELDGRKPQTRSEEIDDDVEIDYDRFYDHTAVTTDLPFRVDDGQTLPGYSEFTAWYPGKRPRTVPSITWRLTFHHSEWMYLKCHPVALLLDEKRATVGKVEHDGDVVDGGVVETIRVTLPLSTARKIARSKSIELKVCNHEFTFGDERTEKRVTGFLRAIGASR